MMLKGFWMKLNCGKNRFNNVKDELDYLKKKKYEEEDLSEKIDFDKKKKNEKSKKMKMIKDKENDEFDYFKNERSKLNTSEKRKNFDEIAFEKESMLQEREFLLNEIKILKHQHHYVINENEGIN